MSFWSDTEVRRLHELENYVLNQEVCVLEYTHFSNEGKDESSWVGEVFVTRQAAEHMLKEKGFVRIDSPFDEINYLKKEKGDTDGEILISLHMRTIEL